MRIPIRIRGDQTASSVHALLDSGAQGKFINRSLVRRLGLTEQPLEQAIPVYNVDGTPNQLGFIRNAVVADVQIGTKTTKEKLLVTHLGKQDVILGIDWLQQHNPSID